MSTPPIPTPKCPNPECKIDLVLVNGQLPDKCEKCGFVIDGWEPFRSWFKTAMKMYEEGKTPPAPPAPIIKKKKGILSSLGRK